MFNGDADYITIAVQIQVNIFIEFARLNWRIGGKFNQCGVSIFKIFDSHGLLLKVSVKEGVVNGLAVLEQDNSQCAIFHFGDARPTANSAIRLNFLAQWILNNALNPFILNEGAVGALAGILEVLCELHCFNYTVLSTSQSTHPPMDDPLGLGWDERDAGVRFYPR